jgi:hypothetical protein
MPGKRLSSEERAQIEVLFGQGLRWLLVPVLLLAGVVAGCSSPPPESRVAIRYLGDGQAEVLALVCQGQEVVSVEVYESDADGHGKGWVVGPPAMGGPRDAKQTEPLRVKVFDNPEGWEATDRSLTQLAPGVSYGAAFSTVQGQRSMIRFTLDKLEDLGDRVLTGPWQHEQAVSESDFVKAARADCDKRRNNPAAARPGRAD